MIQTLTMAALYVLNFCTRTVELQNVQKKTPKKLFAFKKTTEKNFSPKEKTGTIEVVPKTFRDDFRNNFNLKSPTALEVATAH